MNKIASILWKLGSDLVQLQKVVSDWSMKVDSAIQPEKILENKTLDASSVPSASNQNVVRTTDYLFKIGVNYVVLN